MFHVYLNEAKDAKLRPIEHDAIPANRYVLPNTTARFYTLLISRPFSTSQPRLQWPVPCEDTIQDVVYSLDDPFSAFIACKPLVFCTLIFDFSSFEKTKGMACQLRSNHTFSTKAGNPDNGPYSTTQVPLIGVFQAACVMKGLDLSG